MCEVCNNRGWLISDRDDGRQAVERCDACLRVSCDESAAKAARDDGVLCATAYPCYLVDGDGAPPAYTYHRGHVVEHCPLGPVLVPDQVFEHQTLWDRAAMPFPAILYGGDVVEILLSDTDA